MSYLVKLPRNEPRDNARIKYLELKSYRKYVGHFYMTWWVTIDIDYALEYTFPRKCFFAQDIKSLLLKTRSVCNEIIIRFIVLTWQ